MKGKLLRTAGYATIALGIYMVYLGSQDYIAGDIIDAEFEILED